MFHSLEGLQFAESRADCLGDTMNLHQSAPNHVWRLAQLLVFWKIDI
jgi:hypothetical protein